MGEGKIMQEQLSRATQEQLPSVAWQSHNERAVAGDYYGHPALRPTGQAKLVQNRSIRFYATVISFFRNDRWLPVINILTERL